MVEATRGREGFRFTLDTPMGMHWFTAFHKGMSRTIPWQKEGPRTHFARVTLRDVAEYGRKIHLDVHIDAHPGGCPGCSGHPPGGAAYAVALARFRMRCRRTYG